MCSILLLATSKDSFESFQRRGFFRERPETSRGLTPPTQFNGPATSADVRPDHRNEPFDEALG